MWYRRLLGPEILRLARVAALNLPAFETFLVELGQRGVAFAGLDDVAARALAAADEVSVAPVVRGSVDGRSGWIAAQAWARRGEPSIR